MSVGQALSDLLQPLLGAREAGDASSPQLASAIAARMEALRLTSSGQYLEHARRFSAEELPHLAGALTNGWTWFFRDPHPVLELAERLAARPEQRVAHIWVAGCSTGEEAYSVVLACLERDVDVRALGTDIDALRIAHAREGIYLSGALRRVSPALLDRYFERIDGQRVRVGPELAQRVSFQVHNLLDAPVAPPTQLSGARWDAIVCRNVLLHLSVDAARRVLRQLLLAPADEVLLAPADRPPTTRAAAPRPSISTAAFSTAAPSTAAPSIRWADIGAQIRRGAHHQARQALSLLAEQAGAGAAVHMALGNLALYAGDLPRAAAAYRLAEIIEPTSAELHFSWGMWHLRCGAWNDAAQSLRRAIFLDGDLWPAWLQLASALERAGIGGQAERARREGHLAMARRKQIAWTSFVDELDGLVPTQEQPSQSSQ